MTLPSSIGEALTAALGVRVEIHDHRPLRGGCINHAARVDTDRGPFFVKWNTTPGAFFSAEAVGLRALRNNTTTLEVPEPIVARDPTSTQVGFLATLFIEPGQRSSDFDETLGRGLAELHRTRGQTFGFERDTFCGNTIQPNPNVGSWVEFYREHRLRHQLELSRELYGDRTRVFERLFARLDDLLADDEPPALIHGDLWSGNVVVSNRGPALIDPAVYFAHREAELGMMTLFGGFSARVFDAYEESYPLRAGWRDRSPMYQLYHLMNHATLFGGSYVDQALAVAGRY